MELSRIAILVVVGGIVLFFLSQIVLVLYRRANQSSELREHLIGATYVEDLRKAEPAQEPRYTAPVDEGEEQQPNQMPEIPGQMEEEVRMPEPTQRRVARNPQRDVPDFMDPRLGQQEDSSFGENLRHPEASFQRHPLSGGHETQPSVGNLERRDSMAPIAAELAQNTGELMKGIFAYDSDNNTDFSPLF